MLNKSGETRTLRSVEHERPIAREERDAIPDHPGTEQDPQLAYQEGRDPTFPNQRLSKEDKVIALNSGILAGVALYGTGFWDFGGASFHVEREGWFGKKTSYGGADKLGHAYSTYVSTIGFSEAYRAWGYDADTADAYGALSGFGMFGLIELGDGASKSGFSFEDLAADAVGASFGYLRNQNPTLEKLVDFRTEYFPSESVRKGGKGDIFTDYSGFKYVLAFKLDGIEDWERTPLRYFELQIGYYTRGYVSEDAEFYNRKRREPYAAVGINLSRVFRDMGLPKIGKFFNYYQAPFVYIATSNQ